MPILKPQERLGTLIAQRFLVQALLAEGGMGVVFRAEDLRDGGEVALKILREAEGGEVADERWRREQVALAQLCHPNIVTWLEAGATEDGVGFIVMEYVRGDTLATWLTRNAPLSGTALLDVVMPLLGALAFAHRAGFVHRDVKPANVLLALDGRGGFMPKLADFGLAKDLRDARVTSSGRTVGTPRYMAPEQVRGERAVGCAADVWAMGVICFEALTGHTPFEHASPGQLMIRVATERAPRLAEMPEVVARTGPSLVRAIDRALEPDMKGRFPDASALARALLEAAVRDGIGLPQDPDPIGLPDYRALRAQAELAQSPTLSSESIAHDESSTQGAESPAHGLVRQSEKRRPGLTSRWLALALVISLMSWGASLLLQRDDTARNEPRPARETSRSEPRPAAPGATAVPAEANPASSAATGTELAGAITRAPEVLPSITPGPSEGSERLTPATGRPRSGLSRSTAQPPRAQQPAKPVPEVERAISQPRSVLEFEPRWR